MKMFAISVSFIYFKKMAYYYNFIYFLLQLFIIV